MHSQPNWSNRTLELFEWPDLSKTKATDEACKWLQANPTVWENWLPDATKCFPQFGLYNRASAPWALKLERKVISFRLQFLSTKTSAKPPVWSEVQKYTWHISKRVWNHWIFGGSRAINDGILNHFIFCGVWCRNKSWSESVVLNLDGLAQSPPKMTQDWGKPKEIIRPEFEASCLLRDWIWTRSLTYALGPPLEL